jgi:5-methyltetrahydrofolate--homocysteine methyltransferase
MMEEIQAKVIAGDAEGVSEKLQVAIDAGENAADILNLGMISAMQLVGQRFESGECFVPEMLIAARAMQAGLVVLRPHLVAADVKPLGKVVLGTVQGDLHDIGKNLVAMMLEGAGFEVIDLGVNIEPEKFVNATKENQPHFVAMSGLLTTTMPNMKKTLQALTEAGLRSQVKIMVGGAPVTQDFADEIGADFFASNAAAAANVAKENIKS